MPVCGCSLIDWWWCKWESVSSTFCFQQIWGFCVCGQHLVNFSHLVGSSVSAKQFKDIAMCGPWGKPRPRLQFSSVHFSRSVVSDSLRPHGLQHARPPCPLPMPGVYSNSSPWSRWCHPTISSSVIPFSSHLQSFLASGSFQMSWFFTSGGQSIGVSASASVLPMNIQDWFRID